MATDSFTSAICGEQEIWGVGEDESVEPLAFTHWYEAMQLPL
jgi:hypothetical protein